MTTSSSSFAPGGRITLGWLCSLAGSLAAAFPLNAEHVRESPKEIPVASDVDVVVVGGSSGAVAAACEAAKQGSRVFLLAPRPYLGTDICSTLRLWLEEDERPQSKLAVSCFGANRLTTPLTVKAAMDRALLEAGVSYLTGCYVTDVLRDREGRLAGVLMANRSGRQAVRAKVIVDATSQAAVARLAATAFRPFVPGPQTFTRVVIGGSARTGANMAVEKKAFTVDFAAQKTDYRLPVYEYTLTIDLPDSSVTSFVAAENLARDVTNGPGAEVASEVLFHVPSDTVMGEQHLDSWPGADATVLGPFRPQGVARLYVLGAYADLGREALGRLLRPLQLMELGTRIGRAAAAEARGLPAPDGAELPEMHAQGGITASVGEALGRAPASEHATIRAGGRVLPVLGRYDVVVVGGGTSGAPAGIAAAKNGAKTLVIEYLYELGGVGTVGLIANYWYGRRQGFTQYVDQHVKSGRNGWNAVDKAEWLRRDLTSSGADVWFGVLGCGALCDGGQVRGVVVATPQGRGAVLATTVVDASGNGDVAACAGAPTEYGISRRGSLNVQIAGFPERPLKQSYVNTCYTMVDDTDVLDVWHLMVWKRTESRQPPAFDVGQLVDSRERRRVVGDYTLTVEDVLSSRTFPDTISQHYSNFDAAAFPDSRLLLVSDAKGPCFHTDLPYRCLLPKGLDGILVVGLGASAERDAMTLIRMQADLQNQGYAAGVAAAAAAKLGGHPRRIDIKAVQKTLIDEGVLDARVATDRDSDPRRREEISYAVRMLGAPDARERLTALALIMAHGAQAIPLLQKRYRESPAAGLSSAVQLDSDQRSGPPSLPGSKRQDAVPQVERGSEESSYWASPAGMEQLNYARILGILGDSTGVPALIAAVDAHDRWDRGMALTSQRKTGNLFSELDRLVIALGFSGASEAVAPLLRKLGELEPNSKLSHYKAISLALWEYDCPAAAEPLAKLLSQPGFTGHATVQPIVSRSSAGGAASIRAADRLLTADGDDDANRANLNRALKELIIAALLYRCGDRNGLAEAVLHQYARDLHGHFASYATQTLDRRATR